MQRFSRAQIRAANSDGQARFRRRLRQPERPLVKLQCPEVDFVCRGDGEQLILDLLEHIEDPERVAGLTWDEGRKVSQQPKPAA